MTLAGEWAPLTFTPVFDRFLIFSDDFRNFFSGAHKKMFFL
jgi:hypothetical protein